MSGTMFNQDGMPVAISMPMLPPTTSPSQSSPDSFEVETFDDATQATHWDQNSPNITSQPRPQLPLQKRRRVTRACDECRRKKIKCDGKQPCTHCTVYSYDCSYDQPSNRRRNPAPQYIEALENRLQTAENLLRTVLPNVDISDPSIEALIQQWRQSGNVKDLQGKSNIKPVDVTNGPESDAKLRSMIQSTGQLDLDDKGHWDFHGGSSGTVFVRRMQEQFGGLLGSDRNGPLFPKIPRSSVFSPVIDSPKSSTESPFDSGLPNTLDLPVRDIATALCKDALDRACSLLCFVHKPSFYAMVDRIYDVSPDALGDSEHRFLPLLYTVLALGCMFHDEAEKESEMLQYDTYEAAIAQGEKYFRAAKGMIEITDCRDITSLQAILFMILFLQSSANLSTCYSYIGITLRSALRMGLHRSLSGNFNPIERETRRRVFWVIRKMDTYVSALLGFPQMLSDDDIDQEFPLEVDDEFITENAVLPMPAGQICLTMAASNAHTRLMYILAKVIKYIYPTKGLEESVQGATKSSYVISHTKIKEIEKDLDQWSRDLPEPLRPSETGPPQGLRVQQLLRLAYAHVQMMLYRPFLHYVSEKNCAGKTVDERSYACAAACVNVSRNIVAITNRMKEAGLLVGAFWFTMYTTFFAILSLVYYVLENPGTPTALGILEDANKGKDALNGLALRSQAADRCSHALRGLFEQLPGRLKEHPPVPALAKKRRATPSSIDVPATKANKNQSDMSQKSPVFTLGPRSRTFPMPVPVQAAAPPRASLDGYRPQDSTLSNPNLRQSYHDLIAQPDMSSVGTPESSSTGTSIHTPYMSHQQFGINNAVPNLNAIMFPTNNPFAYPNQPMTEYENIKQETIPIMNGSPTPQLIFPSPGDVSGGGGMYDDLEGQLLGPIPPYLQQGIPNYGMQQQQMGASNMIGDMSLGMGYHTGLTPNNDDMAGNFDNFFSADNMDWGNSLNDMRFRQ